MAKLYNYSALDGICIAIQKEIEKVMSPVISNFQWDFSKCLPKWLKLYNETGSKINKVGYSSFSFTVIGTGSGPS